MDTRLTEIGDGIHQLTTYVSEMDFGFNQYLVSADEPLLFHTKACGVEVGVLAESSATGAQLGIHPEML